MWMVGVFLMALGLGGVMLLNWLRRLLFREEVFESHINTLVIKWDRIPNPTKETREVAQVPVHAHRTIARNNVGRLLLKRRWKRGSFGGPASLTQEGVLEVYPLPKHLNELEGESPSV